ncbi:hypothetical protein OURE66S_01231 [Oligella ureolytica]
MRLKNKGDKPSKEFKDYWDKVRRGEIKLPPSDDEVVFITEEMEVEALAKGEIHYTDLPFGFQFLDANKDKGNS